MESGFGPEGLGLTSDTAKDPARSCGVRGRGSASPVVGRLQFIMSAISGEKFSPLSETYQNAGGGDEWYCHLSPEAEIGHLPL